LLLLAKCLDRDELTGRTSRTGGVGGVLPGVDPDGDCHSCKRVKGNGTWCGLV